MQDATYYGLACKVIDDTQPTMAKVLLETGELWVPKKYVKYDEE